MPKRPRPDIPQKYRPLVAARPLAAADPRGRQVARTDRPTPLPGLRARRKFHLNQLAGATPPTLTKRDLVRRVMEGAGVDRATAQRVVTAIVAEMTRVVVANLRGGHDHVCLRDLGTFRRWRHRYGHRFVTGRKGDTADVRFTPHPSWYAAWMPVVAYDAAGQPVGIYDGWGRVTPWGHPDNPYPGPDDVPLTPERYWQAATPLPEQPQRPRRAPEWDVARDPACG